MKYIESINKLVEQFTKLPGVGKKTATRYAYSVIKMDEQEVANFATSIVEAKQKVHFCSVCGAYTDLDVCEICRERKSDVICVVKEAKDIDTFEKLGEFNGVYHVLNGQLSPMNNIGPEELRIKELLARLDNVQEVIIATSPDVEGDATALYLSRLIKPLGIKVTRLARGIPSGSDLEFTDEATLLGALKDRKTI